MSRRRSKQKKNENVGKWVWIGVGVLFVGSILWSMWVDTLRPIVQSGDEAAIVNNLIGLPLILLATAIIIYGGWRVVKATFNMMQDEALQENVDVIRKKGDKTAVRQARIQNAMLLFRAWANGAAIMALGFGLMAIGGWLINR